MYFFHSISEKIFLIANSEDSDLMPCSAASDLGLHCLPMLNIQVYDTEIKRQRC